MKTTTRVLTAVALAAMLAPRESLACAVCMGDPNSKVAGASNGMMMFLLATLAGVFCLLGAFAYHLFRMSRAPMPPHAELGGAVDALPNGN
jgi:hypothetical protein